MQVCDTHFHFQGPLLKPSPCSPLAAFLQPGYPTHPAHNYVARQPCHAAPRPRQVAKFSAGAARYSMGGLGFGLPLSRLYARYFGGDLKLVSMPGYGVNAYLDLRRLEGYDWQEMHADAGVQDVLEKGNP